jgi:hypothetical protein
MKHNERGQKRKRGSERRFAEMGETLLPSRESRRIPKRKVGKASSRQASQLQRPDEMLG